MPTAMMKMKCSPCVHLFAVLDYPEHGDGMSIKALADITGLRWGVVDFHVKHHLARARWVEVSEATVRGSKTIVRLAHNPAVCRTLRSRAARPLCTVEKLKPPAREAPKLATPREEARDPARGDLSTPRELPRDPARAFTLSPSICDLSTSCPAPTPAPEKAKGGQERKDAQRQAGGDHSRPANDKTSSPADEERSDEERAAGERKPFRPEPRDAVAAGPGQPAHTNGHDPYTYGPDEEPF